ncbi:MAG: hypothetical protein ACRDHZ_14450 [Ktedonobacteraceae bacterium]
MSFGGRVLRLILRPVYRTFFERPLDDIIARLQNVEHLSVQLRDAEANLAAQMHNLRAELVPYLQRGEVNLSSLEPRVAAQLRSLEANNAAQWDGIEQLLLAMFRLPQPQISALDGKAPDEPQYLKAIDIDQVHAASNLR